MALPIKISLPEGFLNEEVRCGYNVTEKLKKIWSVELDLANEFMRVVQKYNLRTFMFGGTLIGAVRHKGFIPWDDDLDFWMPREDYDKFIQVSKEEFNHPYFLQHGLSDQKFFLPYARLRNSLTTGAIKGEESGDYNNGIYIDIYVLDGYPKSMMVHKLQSLLIRLAALPCTLYNKNKYNSWSVFKKCALVLRPIIKLFSYEMWFKIYENTLKIYNKSQIIGGRFGVSASAYKYNYKRSAFDDIIYLPFEHLMLPAPSCYDDLLKKIYGDYMSFPPVEERGKWHEGIIHFEPDIPYKEYLSRKNDAK